MKKKLAKSLVELPKRHQAGHGKIAVAARRKTFIEAYIANGFNATQAAITAGLSPKTAYSSGHRMLKSVETKSAIAVRLKQSDAVAEINTDRTRQALARIAYGEPTDPLKWSHKIKALDLAAKHLGMYDKENSQAQQPAHITIVYEDGPGPRDDLDTSSHPKLLPPPAVEPRDANDRF
jgi:hypothetical protein